MTSINPSYTSLPRTKTEIEARMIELKNSGKLTARSKTILNERLQDMLKEAKLGQVGAKGDEQGHVYRTEFRGREA